MEVKFSFLCGHGFWMPQGIFYLKDPFWWSFWWKQTRMPWLKVQNHCHTTRCGSRAVHGLSSVFKSAGRCQLSSCTAWHWNLLKSKLVPRCNQRSCVAPVASVHLLIVFATWWCDNQVTEYTITAAFHWEYNYVWHMGNYVITINDQCSAHANRLKKLT